MSKKIKNSKYLLSVFLIFILVLVALDTMAMDDEEARKNVYKIEKNIYEELVKQGLSKQEISDELYRIEQQMDKVIEVDGSKENVLAQMQMIENNLKAQYGGKQETKASFVDTLSTKKSNQKEESTMEGIVLAEGDVLQIEVDNYEEFNTITSVGTDGNIRLHLVGEVLARGLTLAELKDSLTRSLATYIRRPKVSLRTKKNITGEGDISFSYTVYLFGQVPRPGSYTVTGKSNVVQVISLAGGLSKSQGSGDVLSSALGGVSSQGGMRNTGSDLSRVTIIRADGQVDWVNITQLLKTGKGGGDISLRPGDTIYISPASFENIDVLGEVVVPGSYALAQGQRISLFDAIALAKGLGEDAAIHNIKVINKDKNHDYVTTIVDLKKAIKSRNKIPHMPTLGAGDAVFISKTTLYHWKRLFSWISTTAGASTTLNSWLDLKSKLQNLPVTTKSVNETFNTYDELGRLVKTRTDSSAKEENPVIVQ